MEKIVVASNKHNAHAVAATNNCEEILPSKNAEYRSEIIVTTNVTTPMENKSFNDEKSNSSSSLSHKIIILNDASRTLSSKLSNDSNKNRAEPKQYQYQQQLESYAACETNKVFIEQNYQQTNYNNDTNKGDIAIDKNHCCIDSLPSKDQFGRGYDEPQKSLWLSSLHSVIFIITCALAVFIVFRNVLTWHLQSFWGASGDFWQYQWDKFIDITGDDPLMFWVFGTNVFTTLVYWSFGCIYTFMDITNRPTFLRKYKIQPGTNEPVDQARLLKVICRVLSNQIFVAIPISYLSYKLMQLRGLCPIRELPTFHWVCVELTICILVEELAFYYSHRLLHHKYIYKYIHKKHHEWTAPISVTAIYCHPIEHIFSNLLPPFLGVFIMGSHVATAWMWFALAILSTLNAHSGYHLPFFPSPEAHDFHHLKFNNCFGVLGVLDRLHGTDALFRATKSYARHIMMLSFVPPREAFPDDTMK